MEEGRRKLIIIGSISASVILIALVVYFLIYNNPSANCAKEGEQFSKVYTTDYKQSCCQGLDEWNSGMDSSISVEDVCFDTGLLKGSPVGTCIDCGNGICDNLENPCNCPEDCIGKGKSTYLTIESFCNDGYGIYCNFPDNSSNESALCNLC